MTKETICVKTHKSDTDHIHEFDSAVLLMRNPYKALVAEVFRRMIFDIDVSGTIKDGLDFFKLDGMDIGERKKSTALENKL